MTIEGQDKKSRISIPERTTLRADGPEGDSVVIPFRQTHPREIPECGEPSQDSGPADFAEEEPFMEREEVPVVCVPWCAETGCTQRNASSSIPSWLRIVLLMAVFTIYTATAVAVCLSLD
jgi:hypothetical protein